MAGGGSPTPPAPTPAPTIYVGTNGTSDDGAGLLAALTQARSAHGRLVVRGPLTIRSPTVLRSGDTIEFDRAVLTLGYNGNIFNASGESNLTMLGVVEVHGGKSQGFLGNGWLLLGGSTVTFDWQCQCSEFSVAPSKF